MSKWWSYSYTVWMRSIFNIIIINKKKASVLEKSGGTYTLCVVLPNDNPHKLTSSSSPHCRKVITDWGPTLFVVTLAWEGGSSFLWPWDLLTKLVQSAAVCTQYPKYPWPRRPWAEAVKPRGLWPRDTVTPAQSQGQPRVAAPPALWWSSPSGQIPSRRCCWSAWCCGNRQLLWVSCGLDVAILPSTSCQLLWGLWELINLVDLRLTILSVQPQLMSSGHF